MIKKHTAIGFKNNTGGYELRSENFKGSSSPKDVTLIERMTQKSTAFLKVFSASLFSNAA